MSNNLEKEIEDLSHEDLCEITQSSLRRLITSDSLLADLPADVTPEEVLAQVAVIHGQSITVNVSRYSETPLSVVIPQKGATVLDLKRAIRRSFTLNQQRQKSKTKISWKYVWKTYTLQNVSNGAVLKNDKLEVGEYGISNKSNVRFIKKLRRKDKTLETCS